MNGETSPLENVINPKSLERQIKIIEQRLLELQTETSALEKRREACHILLGQPLAPIGAGTVEAATATPPKKPARPKKKETSEPVVEVENTDVEPPEERSIIRASELRV